MEHAHFVSFEAAASVEEAARRNHYEGEAVTESFWSKAAASLPPHVRRRYGHLFEAAEQYEPVLELVVDTCADAWRALAKVFGSGTKRHDVKRHGIRFGVRLRSGPAKRLGV
jgi:hypothetical protein